jgi:aminoglycoside phosphotransferase (APT) family kinase protein
MSGLKETPSTERLAKWLTDVLATAVTNVSLASLSGGAIQENWKVTAQTATGPMPFVIRKDAPATISASLSRHDEFQVTQGAAAAGVTVATPIAFCDDPSVIGGPFALMEHRAGIGLGPKLVKTIRDEDRQALTERLGHELACIHKVTPASGILTCLGQPPPHFAKAEIETLRGWLDELDLRRPALEWALRWCETHISAQTETTLTHRDFRTGNYLVEDGKLTAILDWEFASWGDPMFDIGWFHAACWRFGRQDLEAGGIGTRADFSAAYEQESGRRIDHERVLAYEVLSHLRWAVIALQQGERHRSGREPSIEHALTGLIAEELELAALRMTPPERWSPA